MSLSLNVKKKRSPVFKLSVFTFIFGTLAVAGLAGLNYLTGYGPNTIVSALGFPSSAEVVEKTVTNIDKASHSSSPSHPKLLSIPDLKVKDARIFAVEQDGRGEVASPKNVFDVGWYKESAMAEDRGVMLLSAHSHGDTTAGVFSGIGLLKPNMEIKLINGDNTTYTYSVKDVKKYHISDLEGKRASLLTQAHPDSSVSVHLITSTGKWVPALQTYDQRIVVRASQN